MTLLWSMRFGDALSEKAEKTYLRLNPDDCKFSYMTGNFFQFSSQFVLLALTIDRYIFIKKPLHYPLIMTQSKMWLLFAIPFCIAMLYTVIEHLTFELPLEDSDGEICAWMHVFPPWFQISICLAYLLLLILVILIYGEMMVKFRQSRKRIQELQKSMKEEDFTKSNLRFQKTKGIFKIKMNAEVPGVTDVDVHTLTVKTVEKGETMEEKNFNKHLRKRRPSSIARMTSVLVSHTKAAHYILILVVTLLLSLAPMYLFILYESLLHLNEKDSILTNSTLDTRSIYRCLSIALQNKECNMEIEIEADQQDLVGEAVKLLYHQEETSIYSFLTGNFVIHFHSALNPLLYAFWYADFRTYLAQIPQWFKQRKPNYENEDQKYELPQMKGP